MSDRPPTPPDESPDAARASRQAQYDWTEIAPSTAVLEAVAVATNTDPVMLPPLYECVDPDMLDALLGRPSGGVDDGTLQLSFAYAGQTVLLDQQGTLRVTPRQEVA